MIIYYVDRDPIIWSYRISELQNTPLKELEDKIDAIALGLSGKVCGMNFVLPGPNDEKYLMCERPAGHTIGPIWQCGIYDHSMQFESELSIFWRTIREGAKK